MPAVLFSRKRLVPLVAAICCLLAGPAAELVAQTRRPPRRPAAPNQNAPMIPGVNENLPAAAREALQQRLQEPITERDRRRIAAAREAQTLRRAYDADPHAETADRTLYLAGARFLEAHQWRPAQGAFQELTEAFPESLWSHEARLALFDLAFEADLDPEGAHGILDPTVLWTLSVKSRLVTGPVVTQLLAPPAAGGSLPVQLPGPPLNSEGDDGAPRPEYAVAADAHLRAGLLRWLGDEVGAAREHFREAFQLDPSPHSPVRLLAHTMLQGRRAVDTPPQALEGGVDVARLIRYADLIHNSLEMYRAHRLWDALLTKRSRDLSPVQRSYVLYRRGHARFRFLNPLERDPEAILKDYETSRRLALESPWAAETLLLAANVAWNLKRDQPQAVTLWQKLADEHPESPHAERGLYYIGIAWEQSKDWERAFRAFEEARRRYPESSLVPLIDKHLKTVQGRLPRPREPRTDLVPVPERKPVR